MYVKACCFPQSGIISLAAPGMTQQLTYKGIVLPTVSFTVIEIAHLTKPNKHSTTFLRVLVVSITVSSEAVTSAGGTQPEASRPYSKPAIDFELPKKHQEEMVVSSLNRPVV